MMSSEPSYEMYEVVVIRDTPTTREDAIAGKTAAILGVSIPDREGRSVSYVVGGHDFDETHMVREDEIEPTGRFDAREDHYTGESISVTQDGEIVDD
ncbi:MAG: hypothetical protein M3N47_07340 [Chloroflexota bacterium]|nr:hypothetical protein [Chloroflexota bacterium]